MPSKYVAGDQLWVSSLGGAGWWPAVVCEPHQYDPCVLEASAEIGDTVIVFYHNEQEMSVVNSHDSSTVKPLEFDSDLSKRGGPTMERAIAQAKLDRHAAQRRREDFLERQEELQREAEERRQAEAHSVRQRQEMFEQQFHAGGSSRRTGAGSTESTAAQHQEGDGGEIQLNRHDMNTIRGLLQACTRETRAAIFGALAQDGMDLRAYGLEESQDEAGTGDNAGEVHNGDAGATSSRGDGDDGDGRRRKRGRDDSGGPPSASASSTTLVAAESSTASLLNTGPRTRVRIEDGWDSETCTDLLGFQFSQHTLKADGSNDALPLPPLDEDNSTQVQADYNQYPMTLGPGWETVSVVAAGKVESEDVDLVCELDENSSSLLQKDIIRSNGYQMLLVPLGEEGEAMRGWMETMNGEKPGEIALEMRAGVHWERWMTEHWGTRFKSTPSYRSRTVNETPEESVYSTREVPPYWHEAVSRQSGRVPRTAIPMNVTEMWLSQDEQRRNSSSSDNAAGGKRRAAGTNRSRRRQQAEAEGDGQTASAAGDQQPQKQPGTIHLSVRFVGPERATYLPESQKDRTDLQAQLFDGTLALVVAKKRKFSELVEWVRQRQPSLVEQHGPPAQYVNRNDETLECFTVEPKCPVSMKDLSCPARGIHCEHTQPIELDVLIQRGLETHLWCCPLCHRSLALREIFIDEALENCLAAHRRANNRGTGTAIKVISYKRTTGYTIVPDEERQTNRLATMAEVVDLDD